MSEELVIVVDDDPSVSSSLRWFFESFGLDVETYDSAESFLARQPLDRPACLVLDVCMPSVNGLKLQERLNQQKLEIPTIFISAHADVPMSVRALKAGALDFFEKPFETEELLRAVRRGLDLATSRRLEQARANDIDSRLRRLTPREREVLSLVTSGLSNKQVAHELGASEATIKIHRGRVMRKMEADSFADLVRLAEGLVDEDARPEPRPD